ncbi:MAG: NAD-dependent epimerase/dehydratase family protein, partial [Fimbriiglobus sp.]
RNDTGPGPRTRVVGLVRNLPRAVVRFQAHAGRPDLELVEHDVTAPFRHSGPVDWVVHAASPATPREYLADPVGTIAPNTAGTHFLLELAAEKRSAGFLYFSSGEVYGPNPARVPTAEADYGPVDPLDVRSVYAEGKRAGETLCGAWARGRNVPAVIVRPFHTYGPGMRLDDGRVFADFVRDIITGRPLTLNSAGTATRAFTYLADATAGFFTALLTGTPGSAYNVANDAGELSIRGLADLLVTTFADRGLTVTRSDPAAAVQATVSQLQRSCPDVSRLRGLGWAPAVGVAEGFTRTVRAVEWERSTG